MARLANVVNWMLSTFSLDQLPKNYVSYTADEVGRLRKNPLTEVNSVRADLVKKVNILSIK